MGRVLSGWRTTGILSMRSGHPGQVTTGIPTALANIGVKARVPSVNPDFTGDVVLGTPSEGQAKYFDINAFQYNVATGLGARELGNLGRNPLIGPGSYGDDVRDAQRKLQALGLYQGEIDGIFGPRTDAWVRGFQTAVGTASDGIVGPITWRAMVSGMLAG